MNETIQVSKCCKGYVTPCIIVDDQFQQSPKCATCSQDLESVDIMTLKVFNKDSTKLLESRKKHRIFGLVGFDNEILSDK